MKFAALLTAAASAIAVHASASDVWRPTFTFPSESTTLEYGQTYTFTWDVSDAPAQLTNNVGAIYLRQGSQTLPLVLAGSFDITSGSVQTIPIPWLTSGEYSAVLFGDSGDYSPEFYIVSPDPFVPPQGQ